MVLDSKQTTVAYRCPHCGAGVMSIVGLFSLTADMIKLKCDCGKSEMSIVYTNDKKIRITVPCIFCPNPHSFVLNSSLFFDKELFLMPCPYSDVNIAMIGEINNVKAELARSELELLKMLEEAGVDSLEALSGRDSNEQTLTDPQIFDIIMYVINELDAEGKIYCKCDNDTEREFVVEVLDEAISITCKQCGAKRVIPTDSLLTANAFLTADSLYLE